MTGAHRDAQTMFRHLGAALGFVTRNTFTSTLPTDGVWMVESPVPHSTSLPVVAIEIVVSEARKTVRGSILTLEVVSPALGVILIHEEALRRRHIRAGGTPGDADRQVQALRSHAAELAGGSRHRIEVWSFAGLKRCFHETTGMTSLYQVTPRATSGCAA